MSSSSSSHSRSSSEVLLPGKVDETTNVTEQMAKVVPSDANGHNNQFKERMEQTSFSHINESHVNPMLQGDAPDNPKLHGELNPQKAREVLDSFKNLHHGPTRVDSLQQPLERLENVDPDEHSLHQIARDGDVDLMVKLLDRLTPSRAAKRLNKKDGDRFTPLHYAARYNHLQMCRLLVSRGADIHAPGEDDVTALHLVAKYKPKKERIDAPDYDSSDGSSEDDGREAQEANLKVLDFLIAAGVRVNGKDFYGLTALHHASVRGNLCCVKKLMDCKGIAIEATDKQQMTPLHIAAIYGHVDIARSLIDSGANIRCRDGDDGTPLQFAAAEGNLQIVKLILEHAKSESRGKLSDMLDERDNDGNTALHLSVDSGHLPVTEYIINCSLINRNTAALNARRNNHETPVHLAARHGHLDIVQLLIRKGAKINTRDDNGSTPLILAAQYNQDAVVEFLITW
uniref:transient receptor potential cation channel subfamily A member 1 homolog n=1 Tax=Ciona intestinalis TaxID=7719 RepID=UPI00089DC98F|nr:transient receptor potential cation channel subfamily A member 1 homolog [Ciona intestinalis]|eukprot:XP_018670871.1 transient receptor potential cation channel subfamily A member 1 homolog [Ciona intestinalis]